MRADRIETDPHTDIIWQPLYDDSAESPEPASLPMRLKGWWLARVWWPITDLFVKDFSD